MTPARATALSIGSVEGMSVADAALEYAALGWYVVPLLRASKNPGSFLGTGWQVKSSRDLEVIRQWYRELPGGGLALHVGRSGAIAFDVDDPAAMPPVLRDAVNELAPPFQSTRFNHEGRGHYLFALPEGCIHGNGVGSLGGSWGEVRGTNGVIVVAPTSPQEKAPEGCRYEWVRMGPLPLLPLELQSTLMAAAETAPKNRPARPRGCRGVGTADARLMGILDTLLNVKKGNRNSSLHWAVKRMREMIDEGQLSYDRAVALLLAAGRQLKLLDEELIGKSGTGGTIHSGLSW